MRKYILIIFGFYSIYGFSGTFTNEISCLEALDKAFHRENNWKTTNEDYYSPVRKTFLFSDNKYLYMVSNNNFSECKIPENIKPGEYFLEFNSPFNVNDPIDIKDHKLICNFLKDFDRNTWKCKHASLKKEGKQSPQKISCSDVINEENRKKFNEELTQLIKRTVFSYKALTTHPLLKNTNPKGRGIYVPTGDGSSVRFESKDLDSQDKSMVSSYITALTKCDKYYPDEKIGKAVTESLNFFRNVEKTSGREPTKVIDYDRSNQSK